MENNAVTDRYNSAEVLLYESYLEEQVRSRHLGLRRWHFLLGVEPETLVESAVLVEYIYEYSLTYRINAYKAVDRISDIFEEWRSRAGSGDETRELAQAYHAAHSAYWLKKTEGRNLGQWFKGLGIGAILLVADFLLRGTRLLSRPYSFSFISLVLIAVFMIVFPLLFAWLTAPKLSSEERIVGWRVL